MKVLSGVEDRYNRIKTLQIDFTETYTAPGRARQAESGTLMLQKPGKMRWNYSEPAGKQFVSDGKHFYLYSPAANRVQKTPVRESDDMRAPLAFLLGRLNFEKDFRKFEARPEGKDAWIRATPERDDLAYSAVEFIVAPDNRIKSVKVLGQDRSVIEFHFSNEKVNPSLAASVFKFTAPKGSEIMEVAEAVDQ